MFLTEDSLSICVFLLVSEVTCDVRKQSLRLRCIANAKFDSS